jgi:curved DNA-binding protein CbpA
MTPLAQVLNGKNYFEKLSLPVQNVSIDVLKKQYKKLAREIHPDKCSDPRATEAFKSLTEAYEILSDSFKQANYLYEIKKETPQQPSYYTHKRRKTTEEELAEQVRRNRQKPKQPEPPKEQPKAKKPKATYANVNFTYKDETFIPKSTTSDPVSCSICMRHFPTQSMLERHMLFADSNHKHPTFKQNATTRKTEDPVTKIYDL